jgi:type IV pilus assembly protein PilQ
MTNTVSDTYTNLAGPRAGRLKAAPWLRLVQGLLFALMCLQTLGGTAMAAQPNALRDISVSSLPGDRVQLTLTMAHQAPNPVSFTIDNPARIALDLADTRNALKQRNRTIGIGVARSLNTVEARGRTRIVLNLAEMVPYETRVSGNKIFVTLGNASSVSGAKVAASSTAMSSSSGTNHGIKNIDFRRGKGGEARIIVSLSDPSTPVNMTQQGKNIVLDFMNTNLPERLERRLDVTDFGTPVTTIDTYAKGDNVRMVIKPGTGEYDQLAYQSDDVYTVEVKPLTPKEKKAREKQQYTGQRLSLNFQNIEVRAVLQLLADFTGLNMVVSDSVKGNITLRLKNVPWDQALDIILKTKGLAMRRTGNVILVAPSQELAAREKLELEAKQQIQELAPLRTEWFQINYAKASDLAKLIKAKQNSLLSKRGNITLDERTNTLMVRDTAEQLDAIRKLIARLDIPVRQVLIQSRIVIATDDFSRDLGVKFGLSGSNYYNNNQNRIVVGGTNSPDTSLDPASSFANGSNLIVDLGVSSADAARLGLAVGKIGNSLLTLELSAMQAEGRGEIVSSPRVITANQKEALIEQGVEIPYQQATSSGATSVQFKKAVLSLKVTPQITPDDRVILDLGINKDDADFTRAVQGVPPINTRAINTQVLVDNGETVVLGGVYEHTKQYQTTRVPFFGDLPVLGHLFRRNSHSNSKSELLVFITPKIIKQQLNAATR